MQTVATKYFDYGPTEVDYLTRRDPRLGSAIQQLGRVERVVIPDVFAALVHAIVGQLVSTQSAETVWNRMQDTFGAITPENLQRFSADAIQHCGMTMKKARTIANLSRNAANGTVRLDDLRECSDHEVVQRLTQIPGVGQWTAEMILLNCLERPDVVSWGDAAIRRGMEKLYESPVLTREQFRTHCARYSPYGSVASIYLWRISFL